VLVHVHDIFLPFDYPRNWAKRHYSEQCLLAAYLLAKSANLKVVLPLAYVSSEPGLRALIGSVWSDALFQRAFDLYLDLTGSYIATSFLVGDCVTVCLAAQLLIRDDPEY
jgi:hypothetical protein